MKNDTDKEVVVETHANTAITNSNGITDYSVIDPQLDSTLKIPFSKIAKVKKETKIPAKSTITLDVNVEMPNESFDGVILGGFLKRKKMIKKRKAQKKCRLKINMHMQLVLS